MPKKDPGSSRARLEILKVRQAQRLERLTTFDARAIRLSSGWLAGVDEAGRGPLAGPVVAAAVVFRRPLSQAFPWDLLDDSKRLSPAVRQRLYWEIARVAAIGIGTCDEKEIDELNIYHATRLAMKRAVLALCCTPALILVDGTLKIDLPIPQQTVIDGDAKSASIAAASVIAKVYRDAWMCHLDEIYPSYLFKKHKGYATIEHLARIRQFGPSPVHRKSFAPVQGLAGCEEAAHAD